MSCLRRQDARCRFRQMESGFPEEFRDEDEMKRQRKIHDQLITKGLKIITTPTSTC